mmetsp:Transcript_5743/g.15848  ORF Transcript_5743/g.15848 Transcript_5743/m.15848 type:complete len:665 (-) Transcript_5743:38-2032(-)
MPLVSVASSADSIEATELDSDSCSGLGDGADGGESRPPPLTLRGGCAPYDPAQRVILHLDCNCFFLAVHMWHDPRLEKAGPLVLWQFNDVICISPEAKAAGVRKHMRPTEAFALVEGIGGHMVHAYCRKWPGPRVWYGAYNQASRRVFSWLQAQLSAKLHGKFTLERASIDEAYIDVTAHTGGDIELGGSIAKELMLELERETGIRASVGVARNRLLAKLASIAAKPPADGLFVVSAAEGDGSRSAQDLLARTPAPKLPGLGGRADDLARLGLSTAADLQRLPAEAWRAQLGFGAEAAARLARFSRGHDDDPVRAADPKKSLSVSSWLTDTNLGDLAMKEHTGRGGAGVIIGSGWLFEPHTEGVSNPSRARWILLSLIFDLEERVAQEYLDFGMLPTKLTVSVMGPGWRKEPGPGSTDGKSRSRTAAFPAAAFRGLVAEVDAPRGSPLGQRPPPEAAAAASAPSEGQGGVEASLSGPGGSIQPLAKPRVIRHPVFDVDWLAPAGAQPLVQGLVDGPEALDAVPRLKARISALVDSACTLVSTWAKEVGTPVPIARLTITAGGTTAVTGASGGAVRGLPMAAPPPSQRTLAELWSSAVAPAGKRGSSGGGEGHTKAPRLAETAWAQPSLSASASSSLAALPKLSLDRVSDVVAALQPAIEISDSE